MKSYNIHNGLCTQIHYFLCGGFFFILFSFSNVHSPWGEHEIDYVLFYTVPSKDKITIKAHPDEVDDTKWVTKEKLLSMMDDKSLLFSPWFRLIAQKWMIPQNGWWDDLSKAMTTDTHCDYINIHCFDPPKEHMGGGGKAGPLFIDDAPKGDTT